MKLDLRIGLGIFLLVVPLFLFLYVQDISDQVQPSILHCIWAKPLTDNEDPDSVSVVSLEEIPSDDQEMVMNAILEARTRSSRLGSCMRDEQQRQEIVDRYRYVTYEGAQYELGEAMKHIDYVPYTPIAIIMAGLLGLTVLGSVLLVLGALRVGISRRARKATINAEREKMTSGLVIEISIN